jgi:hypothetical protein
MVYLPGGGRVEVAVQESNPALGGILADLEPHDPSGLVAAAPPGVGELADDG